MNEQWDRITISTKLIRIKIDISVMGSSIWVHIPESLLFGPNRGYISDSLVLYSLTDGDARSEVQNGGICYSCGDGYIT